MREVKGTERDTGKQESRREIEIGGEGSEREKGRAGGEKNGEEEIGE